MAEHWLHFHLGPVQSFIAEARRTRDVWAGSFLLSWLAGHAMSAALRSGGKDAAILSPDVSADPMFHAIHGAGADAGSPFLGTLPNHFVARVADDEAGKAAETAVRAAWCRVANAVRMMLFDEGPLARYGDRDGVLERWDEQIGDEHTGPLWEIYWVVCPHASGKRPAGAGRGDDGDALLAARKSLQWSPKQAAAGASLYRLPRGNFCALMTGWREISGIDKRETQSRRRAFWLLMRQRLVDLRYPRAGLVADACLDLRQDEVLCAPALVKRLFPLLHFRPGELERVIGWRPFVRAADLEVVPGSDTRSRLQVFIERIAGKAIASPLLGTGVLVPGEVRARTPDWEFGRQDPVLWPSTSFVAAAHWIARAQRSEHALAGQFAAAIRAMGVQYARAEASVWLKCLEEQTTPTALGECDGAMMFKVGLLVQKSQEPNSTRPTPQAEAALKLLAKLESQPLVIPPGVRRSYSGDDAVIGEPSPCYAVVRADGDRMGTYFEKHAATSAALNAFARDLRGGSDSDPIGVIARHNAITLYAGADEMIAMVPVEDALPLAMAVRAAFDARVNGTRQRRPDLPPDPTVSVAVTFAHRRVPLRWVFESGRELLESTAKATCGRNAVAIELMASGGRYVDWAAPWALVAAGAPPSERTLGAVWRTAVRTVTRYGFLGSNQFLHDVRERLGPLGFPDETADYAERLALARGEHPARWPGRPDAATEALTGALLRHIVMQHASAEHGAPSTVAAEVCPDLLDLLTTFGPHPRQSRPDRFYGPIAFAGLQIVRFLTENWRKDVDDEAIGAALPIAERAAA